MEGDVDENYFSEDFRLDYLIKNLPENPESGYILDHKRSLEKLLNIYSHKISNFILNHQPDYIHELKRITDLQRSVVDSIDCCKKTRSYLNFTKSISRIGSTIVQHQQKRDFLNDLVAPLTFISGIRASIIEARRLASKQRDYPQALDICRDARKSLISVSGYKCVDELAKKISETISMVEEQALSFFIEYHKSSMDELKMFLDSEPWEIVPVKSDFKLVHLKEFYFLRTQMSLTEWNPRLSQYCNSNKAGDARTYTQEIIKSLSQSGKGLSIERNTLPFEKILQLSQETSEDLFASDSDSSNTTKQTGKVFRSDDILASDESDFDDGEDVDDCSNPELNQDFVDEDDDSAPSEIDAGLASDQSKNITKAFGVSSEKVHSGPVLTNSSLNILRLFGRYIQIMMVLEPISYEILMKIYSLLDYYIIVVYKNHGPEEDGKGSIRADKDLSPKLRAVIMSVRQSLLGNSDKNSTAAQQSGSSISTVIMQDLSQSHLDPRKTVAVQSLMYLVNQLWHLQEFLESLIPACKRPQLREQFSSSNSSVPDLLRARAQMSLDQKSSCLSEHPQS